MTGGIVSFGPPLGGVVVFAHEWENIIDPKMNATGIIGQNADNNFFIIFFSLKVCPYDTLNSFDLLQLSYKLFKVSHIIYI